MTTSPHLIPASLSVQDAHARARLDAAALGRVGTPLYVAAYQHAPPHSWTEFEDGWRVCGQQSWPSLAAVMASQVVARCKGTQHSLAVYRRDEDRLVLVTRIRDAVDLGATGHLALDAHLREAE